MSVDKSWAHAAVWGTLGPPDNLVTDLTLLIIDSERDLSRGHVFLVAELRTYTYRRCPVDVCGEAVGSAVFLKLIT